TNAGPLATLRRTARTPLVEWLLVADGRPDPTIRYLVGASHDDLLADLEGILRTALLTAYELREVTWHPKYIEEYLPVDPDAFAASLAGAGGPHRASSDCPIDTARHPELAYDLTRDSMIRLREYADIATDDVQTLLEADLLREDTVNPHLLYSVSAAGRDAINEHYREGVDHGDGKGDLSESSEHVMLVELARRFAEGLRADPEDPVARVEPYYEPADSTRLGLVGFDAQVGSSSRSRPSGSTTTSRGPPLATSIRWPTASPIGRSGSSRVSPPPRD
ncbi:hypothetical protein ACFQE1_02525, partial [Halobium palmae]